jgi:hypothetical protein
MGSRTDVPRLLVYSVCLEGHRTSVRIAEIEKIGYSVIAYSVVLRLICVRSGRGSSERQRSDLYKKIECLSTLTDVRGLLQHDSIKTP